MLADRSIIVYLYFTVYDILKYERLWMDSFATEYQHINARDGIFTIQFYLSPDGLKHIDDIVDMTFAYLQQIKDEGIYRGKFDEIKTTIDLEFRYAEQDNMLATLKTAMKNIHDYPVEDSIIETYLLEDFQPQIIEMILEQLTPDNMYVLIGHRNIRGNRVEPWYNVSYSESPIDPTLLNRWKNTLFGRNANASKLLTLPKKNEYMPDKKLLEQFPASTNVTGKPILVINETGAKMWCMNSHPFVSPKIDVNILLLHWNPYNLRENTLSKLFERLVNEQLDRTLAAAADAGNGFSFADEQFSVNGYDTAIVERILGEVLKSAREFKVDPKTFEIKKQLLAQEFDQTSFAQPYKIGLQNLKTLLINPAWSDTEYKSELANVTVSEMQNFIDHQYFDDLEIEGFIFGAYDCNQSVRIVRLVQSTLRSSFNTKQRLDSVFLRISFASSISESVKLFQNGKRPLKIE